MSPRVAAIHQDYAIWHPAIASLAVCSVAKRDHAAILHCVTSGSRKSFASLHKQYRLARLSQSQNLKKVKLTFLRSLGHKRQTVKLGFTACALDTLRRFDKPIRLSDALAFSPQSLDVLAGKLPGNPKRDVAIPARFAIPAETLLKKHL
jgi:hypothetical protein